MKRISVGLMTAAASGLSFGQGASAADMPLKAPAPPSAFRWSGFYLGGHLGGAWAGSDPATVTDISGFPAVLFPPTSFSNSGRSSFLGGAQIGYNWQFAPHWVAGLEADWTRTKLSESFAGDLPNTGVGASGYSSTLRRDIKSLMSVRGRFGYAMDSMLYYFTGGLAWGQVDYSANTVSGTINYPTSFSKTAKGYVLGGGLEYALNYNWSVRGEYLYYRLDGIAQTAQSLTSPPGLEGTVNYSWDNIQTHVVRLGANYKFGP
jgi:outer membrane immunogenic protein